MNISEYRNRNRKPITLPSGLEGWVRPPSIADMTRYQGLLRAFMGGASPGALEGDLLRDFIHCSLRYCFMPKEGVMSDKEPGQCLPNELSIHELSEEDASAIFTAVREMGGLRGRPAAQEGGPKAAGFPAGAERADGAAGDSGGEVRSPAPPAG